MEKTLVMEVLENEKRKESPDPKILALCEQMQKAMEVLNQAEDFMDAMISFYGQNLGVANWHMNGELEPYDNFVDDNGGFEALDVVRKFIGKEVS